MTSSKASLPVNKINTIMRSSSDVEHVGKESALLMAKAAELFIKKLVVDSFEVMKQKDANGKTLRYQNLATAVQASDTYHFLKDMTPMKITVREYKKIMAKKNGGGGTTEEASSDSDSEAESSISASSRSSVISVQSSD